MNWSAQQSQIFEWFKNGKGNLVVRARAGSGKSTTIVHAVGLAPENDKLVCAFNRRIADEMTNKLSVAKAGAESKTCHGLGYGFVLRNWENAKFDGTRGFRLALSVLGDQAPDEIVRKVQKLAGYGKTLLLDFDMTPEFRDRLIGVAITMDCEPDASWQRDGWTTGKIADFAMQAMDLARHRDKDCVTIDYDDMMFLPLANGWLRPRYDLVVVDEAQDMSAIQLEIAQRVIQPNGRIVLVGDDRQAIYGFRGADSGSLDRLKAELGASELGLSYTYRCGKAIVRYAQKLVQDFHAADTNHEGVVDECDEGAIIKEAKVGDFVVSRTNAPLAPICLRLNRAGIAARIEGKKDITGGLKSLVRRWKPKSVVKLVENIENWRKREIDRLMKSGRPEAMDKVDFVADQADLLLALCDGITKPEELSKRLDTMFGDAEDVKVPMVVCSSIHKAKGLEADRVFVLDWTLYPKRRGDDKRPVEQVSRRLAEEQNLDYVASTRAKHRLTFVKREK